MLVQFENCQNHEYLLFTNCARGLAISYANNDRIREVANSIISVHFYKTNGECIRKKDN